MAQTFKIPEPVTSDKPVVFSDGSTSSIVTMRDFVSEALEQYCVGRNDAGQLYIKPSRAQRKQLDKIDAGLESMNGSLVLEDADAELVIAAVDKMKIQRHLEKAWKPFYAAIEAAEDVKA